MSGSAEWLPTDLYLSKRLVKMLHRIERIMFPVSGLVHNDIGLKLSSIGKRIESGRYYRNANAIVGASKKAVAKNASNRGGGVPLKTVTWDELEKDIIAIISQGIENFVIPPKVQSEIDSERHLHVEEEEKMRIKAKVRSLNERNGQPIITGRWRKEAYPPRKYEHLEDYAVTTTISQEEGSKLREQLITPLNGFLGQAYNYDDHCLTEEWMVTFKDGESGASADDVIRTQLESLLEIMMVQVQDRNCTESGVLSRPKPKLNEQIKEVPVWGIDCYTRRMVELAIEDHVQPSKLNDPPTIAKFIERYLLPAINAQSPDRVHNMLFAAQSIVESTSSSIPAVMITYAKCVIEGIKEHPDMFKIHPKGTGVICINPEGILPHVVVSDYLGEIYPPYRWCERLDVVEQAQQTFGLKPTLPDFYNILLERPRQDPDGYGLLYVDASQKANVGSSCSHSCNSNCTSSVVARDGKLVIVLTTNRYIYPGEELTMDYYSITNSDIEWRAAICLCGMTGCRGSFLHYATQDDLQQVLNQSCGPLWRYASLLRACSNRPLQAIDQAALDRHGMRAAAMGNKPPLWVKKFAADNLRFVEFERKALPCALMRPKKGQPTFYTYSTADMDARSVMEQRLQAMVCCFSMVERVLDNQPDELGTGCFPLRTVNPSEAAERIWTMLSTIPALIEEHMLAKLHQQATTTTTTTANTSSSSSSDGVTSAEGHADGSGNTSAPPLEGVSASGTAGTGAVGSSTSNGASKKEDLIVVKKAHEKRLNAAIAELREQLAQPVPKGLTALRSAILGLRKTVKSVADIGTSRARLGLLADVLALWAFTSNFSSIQEYADVQSSPVAVVARELGTNIVRSKILKPDVGARRQKNQGSQHETMAPASQWPTHTTRPELSFTSSVRGSSGKSADTTIVAAAAAATATAVSAVISSCSSTSAEAPEEVVVPNQPEEVESPVEDTQTSSDATSVISFNGISGSPESILTGATDRETVADAAEVVAAEEREGAESKTGDDATQSTATGDDATQSTSTGDDDTEQKDSSKQAANKQSSHIVSHGLNHRDQVMEPNEPVFMGNKHYSKHFIFRQLMGWYNAGTDQKLESPDLFGCVQVPPPAACFGLAELAYSTKQRDILLTHLRDEKAQPLAWPPVLKACFSTAYGSSVTVTAAALLGSPMLDISLGQVDAVDKLLGEILGGGEGGNVKGKSSKNGSKTSSSSTSHGDNDQFDSILPPEMPTSWVQCEACRKWRRVAWHVDSDVLPDLWDCKLNFWDPENATCDAPQDSYDPDRESTLELTGTVPQAIEDFKMNSWYDVFCLKNRIYYEAQVKKIKHPQKEGQKAKVQFHFKGWSSKFDEWIDADSERINPHNFHTDPTASDPRAQEKWQGAHSLAKMYSSMSASGKPKPQQPEGEEESVGVQGKGSKTKGGGKAAGGSSNNKGKKPHAKNTTTSSATTSSSASKKKSRASTSSAASTSTGTSSKKRSRSRSSAAGTTASKSSSNSTSKKRKSSSGGSPPPSENDGDSDDDLWDDCFGKGADEEQGAEEEKEVEADEVDKIESSEVVDADAENEEMDVEVEDLGDAGAGAGVFHSSSGVSTTTAVVPAADEETAADETAANHTMDSGAASIAIVANAAVDVGESVSSEYDEGGDSSLLDTRSSFTTETVAEEELVDGDGAPLFRWA